MSQHVGHGVAIEGNVGRDVINNVYSAPCGMSPRSAPAPDFEPAPGPHTEFVAALDRLARACEQMAAELSRIFPVRGAGSWH
ncbi:hypothetical protein [Streptomyces sp. NBC_00091]|uniref:hypothetical protein n=1 Tax=Streptomyces sp. NBC_00091 TaxID=2975648 RepID=UPI0022550FD8|nr:hypothetical protein [Streptomyces sp. NBC_00091]MCX5376781.1 hypothetical protein [Streptomyces sp. NBC_00091]